MTAVQSAVRELRARPLPLALGLVFVAQIYFFQWHPGYPNPNEVVRLYLTRAIVDEGTFQIDGMIKKFGDVEDKSAFKGHFYCDKAPGVSFAAVPVLAVAKLFGDVDMKTARHLSWLAVIALPSLLLLLALWRFFGRFGLACLFFFGHSAQSSSLGTIRSVGPPLIRCSSKCESAITEAFDSRMRATISSTLSVTTYLVPSTSVITESGVASTLSIKSWLSANAGPLSRVTVIIDPSLSMAPSLRRPWLRCVRTVDLAEG